MGQAKFAFSPLSLHSGRISGGRSGTVKGACLTRVHRSEAETLDGDDDRLHLR